MLTNEHIAAIEEAAQTLESAAKFNSEMGRTVFANVQADRAKRLREAINALNAQQDVAPSDAKRKADDLKDLWIHDDMDRDGAEAIATMSRKDLKTAYLNTVENLIAWRRRALTVEAATGKADAANAGGLDHLTITVKNAAAGWGEHIDLGLADAIARAVIATSAADAKDAVRLDHMEAWLSKSGARGFKWNSYDFVTGKSVREQLDAAMAAAPSSAATQQAAPVTKGGGDAADGEQ